MHARLFSVMALLSLNALTASAQPASSGLGFDIAAVIGRLADEMNKEFIVDPRLQGVSGLSSTTAADADYETLLAVLRSNGFAAIEVGDQIRIVTEEVARAEPSRVVDRDDNRISDHAVVTRVVDVADIEATLPGFPEGIDIAPQLVPVLRPLMSAQIGNLSTIPGTSKLVIVDRYDNVRRITAIIDELRR